MVSVKNNLYQNYSVQVARNTTKFQKLASEAVTGFKRDNSVIDSIYGMKADQIFNIGNAAIAQVVTGLNMVSTAKDTLQGIEKIINSI